MGLEQPELESGVGPAAGPRLASPGPATGRLPVRGVRVVQVALAFVRTGPAYAQIGPASVPTVRVCAPTVPAFGLTGRAIGQIFPAQVFPATGRIAPARVRTVLERVRTVRRRATRFNRAVRIMPRPRQTASEGMVSSLPGKLSSGRRSTPRTELPGSFTVHPSSVRKRKLAPARASRRSSVSK